MPRLCKVECSFTIDNAVNSVTHNGVELTINGQVDNLAIEKTVEFNCTNEDPGNLVISGSDDNTFDDPSSHCTFAGLILHCTAYDVSNPWHDFVSDNNANWVDENGAIPCASTSGGFLDSGLSFVNDMLAKGAKKIWAKRKDVTLTGISLIEM